MQSKKNNKLNRALRIFLYFLSVTGVCAILPMAGGHLWRSLHIFSGFTFLILTGVHMGKNRKWYKAWIAGKLKSEKSKRSKSITVFFFLMLFSISSDGFLPRGLYLFTHILIGTIWIIEIIRHFKGKQKRGTGKVSMEKPDGSLVSNEQSV